MKNPNQKIPIPTPQENLPPINHSQSKMESIRGKMSLMRYKDLQTACVSRGIDFDYLVKGDVNSLQTWLIRYWDNPANDLRLMEFDKWREQKLKESGRPGEPYVRLGYMGETDENGNIISIKKPEMLVKPKKPQRERDKETGIFHGTKKAYTLELTKAGMGIKEIIKLVMEKYPEAKEKSIKIWHKRFKK